jgi:Domain of unknown function (DUF4037)
MAARFVPGLRLAAEFYTEVVRPLLAGQYPDLRYSAALLGSGSEVLGFDSQRSADHDWGPRLQLFLPADAGGLAHEITATLAVRLPETFRGYPTRFPASQDPHAGARHWVEAALLGPWLEGQLGFDAMQPVRLLDWLGTPTQRLAEVTGGAVFHDGLDELNRVRARLAWYPRDVWLYVLACQWQRIAQEEAFPGRCSEAGDELGSAVVTARLVRDLMRLCLLMHRRYPPYSKWLGSALAQLPDAADIAPDLAGAISATQWRAREQHLCHAYEYAAGLHNRLGLTDPVEPRTRLFYNRPFYVLDAGRFTAALLAGIADPRIRQLSLVGAVDQFIDNTDALGGMPLVRAAVRAAVAQSGR